MKLRRERVGFLVLLAAVSLWLPGATAQLNPLVTRTPQRGAVPVECAEGVAPAPVPRVDVREIPLLPPARVEPAELPAPATGSLRSALEATQTALTRNDRPAFDASLAEARELLETYPSGAQRRSAEELVRLYDTAARLWDAQYQSPFFEESSAEAALLRGYPGYESAVRRSTLTRDGQRWFPAGESRDFLGRVAAERLRGIGIEAPAPRLARNERPGVPDVDAPRASSPRRPSVSRRSTRPSTGTSRATRPPRSAAPSRPRLTTESRTSAPATSTPGSPNPPASPTAAAAPEPAAPSAPPAAEETPTPDVPVASDTTPATAPAPAPETAAEPAAPTPAEPSRSRSVVLPTILILIGLGVLILLFRASK